MCKTYYFWVYIAECSDGSYYTGITNDIKRRMIEHNDGINPQCYTFKRRPVALKYQQLFTDIYDAIAWEKQLKGWSRKKKEALFNKNITELKRLSRSKK